MNIGVISDHIQWMELHRTYYMKNCMDKMSFEKPGVNDSYLLSRHFVCGNFSVVLRMITVNAWAMTRCIGKSYWPQVFRVYVVHMIFCYWSVHSIWFNGVTISVDLGACVERLDSEPSILLVSPHRLMYNFIFNTPYYN